MTLTLAECKHCQTLPWSHISHTTELIENLIDISLKKSFL